MARQEKDAESVVVIGLGRFGGTVAESLSKLGHEVLGIDQSMKIVQEYADRLTHVVQADSTEETALRQLGVDTFQRAVVGIGTHIEASVLTVVALNELGIKQIWAKAVSAKHAKILASVGAHHVIRPEFEMGDRVAHLITSKMIDFIKFDDGFAIAKVGAPRESVGLSMAQAQLRRKYGITVVGIKVRGEDFAQAVPETVIPEGALLIISGTEEQVQRFAALT